MQLWFDLSVIQSVACLSIRQGFSISCVTFWLIVPSGPPFRLCAKTIHCFLKLCRSLLLGGNWENVTMRLFENLFLISVAQLAHIRKAKRKKLRWEDNGKHALTRVLSTSQSIYLSKIIPFGNFEGVLVTKIMKVTCADGSVSVTLRVRKEQWKSRTGYFFGVARNC